MKFCIFDTETTGLPKGSKAPWYKHHLWPHIVQMSWLTYDTDTGEMHCVDRIVNIGPEIEITEGSIEKHGITHKMSLESEYKITDVLKEFTDVLESSDMIVGHNIDFDRNVLMCEYSRNNLKNTMEYYDKMLMYCTMRNSIDVCKIKKEWPNGNVTYKWPTLEELHYTLFRNNPINLHNSLVDIFVTFRCFYKLKFDKDILRENVSLRSYYNELCQKSYKC